MSAGKIRVRTLPEPLPAGEEVLWQGKPDWRSLARRAFHVRMVLAWFGLLFVWRVATGIYDGAGVIPALLSATTLVIPALAAVGLLLLLAWLTARSTLYMVTDRRVVMRIGIALPMTINVPFRIVNSAALKVYSDGSGEIPLTLAADQRIGYGILWPHARPWKLMRAEPMLRTVPDVEKVSEVLAGALRAAAATPAEPAEASAEAPVPAPAAPHTPSASAA